MYTDRIFNTKRVIAFTFRKILMLAIWSSIAVLLYTEAELEWVKIPWVPLTLVGIAVAFYLGFKNNSAYERTWEARKIWGAIVNSSRTWAIQVTGFVTNDFAKESVSQEELDAIKKRLVFRHIAWLYRLKRQLRVIKEWEHNLELNNKYREVFMKQFPVEAEDKELLNFLGEDEVNELLSKKNVATHLIKKQSDDLRELKTKGIIDDFRHMEMQRLLEDFYTQQGKCERIKNFPLPRQYASVSLYFFYIFIFLMPFGLLSAFSDFNPDYIWGTVPFTALIGWIFYMMEVVGDYAENPFENLAFDTPMTSLTRTIEIDLKEMINEKDIPEPIGPVDGVLM